MAETKKRLGRGLNSLLSTTRFQEIEGQPESVETPKPQLALLSSSGIDQIHELPIAKIYNNPHQPRQNWNEDKLLELADSIKANGLIQPILVRPMGQGYQLIAGERRLRATQMAGVKTINAIVRHASEEQMLEWALIENIHRTDLSPLERAGAYKNYLNSFSLSQQEAAGRLGEDRSTIANYIRLLELTDEIKQMLVDGQISMGHARALLGVDDRQTQLRLAKLAAVKKLSVRELERKVQTAKTAQQDLPKQPSVKDAHIQELENEISQALGTKVTIKTVGRKGHRGRIIIEFFTLDDFDRIREVLC